MSNQKAKILVLVEGAKTDVNLMNHLISIYGIDEKHEIVSYDTNIYVLYKALFENGDSEDLDLLQVLKEKERDEEKKKILSEHYSDVLLIFDLDPHDRLYSENKVLRMLEYFNESSENGKLYLNYPMVESFYHMKTIPDMEYNTYEVSIKELRAKKYKTRVHNECRDGDYSKFAKNVKECNLVIKQNVEKALLISGAKSSEDDLPSTIATDVFSTQAKRINQEGSLFVLCTCVFYIVDYNPVFISAE